MLTHFLTANASAIFWWGVGIAVVGNIWFLFDSYRCDVSLARWTMLFPPIGIFLAIRYPEECLKSFLVCVAGLGIMYLGSAYSPSDNATLNSLMTPGLPKDLSN